VHDHFSVNIEIEMAAQYQVLARKWRPQQFAEVVGQEHVTSTLQNAIQQDRLAHAYLFVGSRGIGKTTIARIFAKALNCAKGPAAEPCDKCDNCKEVREGRSLDVLEIDGASNNGVEQVRELRDTVRYAPARAKYKIYIIDEVHMLSTAAFNALLKTLEEPPPHVKFLFATTEPQKILATILSRCQRFDLRRIPSDKIVAHLQKIAKDEKVTIEPAALAAIARGAEGGLRDAESALDQLIAFCGNKIEETDVLGVFGLVAQKKLAALTDALIDGDTNTALRVVKELDDAGKDLQRLLADVLDHFRNLLVLSIGGDTGQLLEVPDTELAVLKTQAQRVDSDAVLRLIDALAGAEGRLRYALSKRVLFEIAVVRAIKARQMVGIDVVLQKLNALKVGLPAPPRGSDLPVATGKAAPALVPGVDATPTAASSIEEAWQYAVEHLGKIRALAKNNLVGARLVGLQGSILTVAFDPEFPERRAFVDRADNREVLQAKLKEKMHRDIMLKFETAEVAAPARNAVSVTKTGPQSLGDYKNDPLIKKALEVFKGTIVDVRQ
jgi:DNA polymerase-3 subunit gamma/tau